jgi:hypothetical protein
MIPPWLTLRLAAYGAATAALALGLWLAYGWAYDRGVGAERARWQASVAEAGTRFAEALAEQQATIAALDRDLAAARRRANQSREDLADALTNDQPSRDWSRDPIPDRVRDALRGRRDLPADPGRAD